MAYDYANVISFIGDSKNHIKKKKKFLSIKQNEIAVPFGYRQKIIVKNKYDNNDWYVEQDIKTLTIKGIEYIYNFKNHNGINGVFETEEINKNNFYKINNFTLNGSTLSKFPTINNRYCINSLLKFEPIYGHLINESKLLEPTIPSYNESYYWDDGGNSREGIRIINNNKVNITGIHIYGTNSYPLYDCALEEMGDDGTTLIRELSRVSVVGNSSSNPPLLHEFENGYNNRITDFVRYTVKDSTLTRILVFGNPPENKEYCLIYQDGRYYSIDDKHYNTTQGMYEPLYGVINLEILSDKSFDVKELFQEKTINGETFRPIDKFKNFKIITSGESMDTLSLLLDGQKSKDSIHIKTLNVDNITSSKYDNMIDKIVYNKKILHKLNYFEIDKYKINIKEDKDIYIFASGTKIYVKEKFLDKILSPENKFKRYQINVGGKDKEDEVGKNNIKGFNFIIQKGTYVELSLDFIDTESKIDSISGLPDGLHFVNGKIKGSPTRAGEFIFYININDGTKIECNLSIPNLIRLF